MSANGGASLEERTKLLLERTGFPHDVHPGQRRYGPRTSSSTPPKDAEIFIGKIPKDCFEDELVPLLEGCGEIYDIRLMMVGHDSESNKGFAFARMTTRSAALECVSKLDKYAIRPGKELGVCISESNCRLFIAGIPKNKTRDEIFTEFSTATKGVLDTVFYADPKDLKKNRGFCFVDFDSHGNASNCRKRILSSRLTVWNKSNLVCDWAIPQEEPGDDVMSKVKTLFVKHIADSVTQAKLEELFGEYGKIEKVNRIKDYAFIFFETREGALAAQGGTNGNDLNGSHISVSLAKPAAKNKDSAPKSSGPGYYDYDPWGYGPPPPPPPPYDYGPPGDDYYHRGPPMVSYPAPHSSSMSRSRSGGGSGSKRGGPGGGSSSSSNRRGRGGSRPEGTPTKSSGGSKDRSSRGRGGRTGTRGGGQTPASKSSYPPNPAPQPEFKQEWNAADYSAAGYASYPGYNSATYSAAAPGWTEDYTSDTWQQPGKRPAATAATPDAKRTQYQPTTPTTQWAGQYQTPAAYPTTQAQQWPAQTWTAQQQPQAAQPQTQTAAWNYQTWKQ